MVEEPVVPEKEPEIATPEARRAYYRLAEDFLRAGGRITFLEWQGLEPVEMKAAMVEAGDAIRRESIMLLVAGLITPDEEAEVDALLLDAAQKGLGSLGKAGS